MQVTVITPPSAIVTWAQLKAHVRADTDDEQALGELYLGAATAHVDGPQGCLGRSFGAQTLEARFDEFDDETDEIVLPYGPIISPITSIKYLSDGVETTWSSAEYALLSDGRIILADGYSWPTVDEFSEAIRVRYQAGYTTVPSDVKAAILLMAAYLFQNREASIEEAFSIGAVRALLSLKWVPIV